MQKFQPTYLAMSVFDIDFVKLYAQGKKIILIDLDNTLIAYNEIYPSDELICLGKVIQKMGFQIYIISNNSNKRVQTFAAKFLVDGYLAHCGKPGVKKIQRLMEQNHLPKAQIVLIGDQLLTDIVSANQLGVDSVLVHSIARESEKWYTTINRIREKYVLKKLAKFDPALAKRIRLVLLGKGEIDE